MAQSQGSWTKYQKMDIAAYAETSARCESLIEELSQDQIYLSESSNRKNSTFTCVARPSRVYFVGMIQVGARGGLFGQLWKYDPGEPIAADRLEVYEGPYGSNIGPLNVPLVNAGDRTASMQAARNGILAFKDAFDQRLTEQEVLDQLQFCSLYIPHNSIKAMLGGKCCPT